MYTEDILRWGTQQVLQCGKELPKIRRCLHPASPTEETETLPGMNPKPRGAAQAPCPHPVKHLEADRWVQNKAGFASEEEHQLFSWGFIQTIWPALTVTTNSFLNVKYQKCTIPSKSLYFKSALLRAAHLFSLFPVPMAGGLLDEGDFWMKRLDFLGYPKPLRPPGYPKPPCTSPSGWG